MDVYLCHENGNPITRGCTLHMQPDDLQTNPFTVRWPRTGSVVIILCNPDSMTLHWMKRRRSRGGVPAKSNLLVKYLPLQSTPEPTRYHFYVLQTQENVPAPGAVRGLIQRLPRPKYGQKARSQRSPSGIQRHPWTMAQYNSNLKSPAMILCALEFAVTSRHASAYPEGAVGHISYPLRVVSVVTEAPSSLDGGDSPRDSDNVSDGESEDDEGDVVAEADETDESDEADETDESDDADEPGQEHCVDTNLSDPESAFDVDDSNMGDSASESQSSDDFRHG